jgi:hypothetical protein
VEANKPITEQPVEVAQPETAQAPAFFQPPTQASNQATAEREVNVAAETPASVAPDIVEAVLQESDSDRDKRLDSEAIALGFPNHATLQVFGGDIDAYNKELEASKENNRNRLARYAGFPDADTLDRYGGDISAYKKQIDDERNEAEAAVLGFPDYATMQQYDGDIAAYAEDQRLSEINRQNEAEAAKAKELGFPDVTTMRQYSGDIAAYNTAETKRLSDIEEKRLADVEEARQSSARNAGFPDAATFDEYAGDVNAYQSALEIKDAEKKQAEAEVLGFPDYATMQQYGGDVSKYNQDLADAKEAKRLADEEEERQKAADQKILDDAKFKRLADEAENKRQSDARASGFPDADTFDRYGGNIDAYKQSLVVGETKLPGDGDKGIIDIVGGETTMDGGTGTDIIDGEDTLTGGSGVVDNGVTNEDDLIGGTGDATLDGGVSTDTTGSDGLDDGLLDGGTSTSNNGVTSEDDWLGGTGGDALDGGVSTDTSGSNDPLLDLSSEEVGQGEVDAINDDALLDLSSPEVGEGELKAIADAESTNDDGTCKPGFHDDGTGYCVADEDKPETQECPEGKVRNLGTGECEDVVTSVVNPVITTVKPVVDPNTSTTTTPATTTTKPKPNPALDALLAGLATPQRAGEDKTEPFYGKMGQYMDIGSDFDYLKPLGVDVKDALKRQQMNKMSVGGFIDALQAEEMTVDDLLNFLQQRN